MTRISLDGISGCFLLLMYRLVGVFGDIVLETLSENGSKPKSLHKRAITQVATTTSSFPMSLSNSIFVCVLELYRHSTLTSEIS
mgnify:CR=1 FL=1